MKGIKTKLYTKNKHKGENNLRNWKATNYKDIYRNQQNGYFHISD